jgi:hypothetical protein
MLGDGHAVACRGDRTCHGGGPFTYLGLRIKPGARMIHGQAAQPEDHEVRRAEKTEVDMKITNQAAHGADTLLRMRVCRAEFVESILGDNGGKEKSARRYVAMGEKDLSHLICCTPAA